MVSVWVQSCLETYMFCSFAFCECPDSADCQTCLGGEVEEANICYDNLLQCAYALKCAHPESAYYAVCDIGTIEYH